jgi:hypothetical protein
LDKYKDTVVNVKNNQQNDEQKDKIIDNIMELLDKKRGIALNKKKMKRQFID